jgi:putative membrane protein
MIHCDWSSDVCSSDLGLFLLVVNAAMIGLTAMFLGGFAVNGLWAGIGAAIVTGVVSWIAGAFIGDEEKRG